MIAAVAVVGCAEHGCHAEAIVTEPKHLENLAAWRCLTHRKRHGGSGVRR